MKKNLHLLTICLFSFFSPVRAQQPFTCQGQFFLTLVDDSRSALLEVNIEPVNNSVVFRTIDNDLGVQINGVGYRSTDNLIYGVDPNDHYLYRIDAAGKVEELAKLPLTPLYSYLAGDITPDGHYLIVIGADGSVIDGRDRELVLIDLTDPAYPVTHRPVSGPVTHVFDVAIDPFTGVIYGFDSWQKRLVTFNPATGQTGTDFPPVGQVDLCGSMFFDAFARLFAYGRQSSGSQQNTLFQIDKTTGLIEIAAMGPGAQGTDACACPYTVEMTKSVTPAAALSCTEVDYIFTISNATGYVQADIDLEDVLPRGWTISQILRNPFGGDLLEGPGGEVLLLKGMTIPPGVDSLIIRVSVGAVPPGYYRNQARLSGLPPSLGGYALSDDPRTLVRRDSTVLQVLGFSFDTLFLEKKLCADRILLLDASVHGQVQSWDDGSTSRQLKVNKPGTYGVTITMGCDTALVRFRVVQAGISVEVAEPEVHLTLGDSILIRAQVLNAGDSTYLRWIDPLEASLSCTDCPFPLARPLRDAEYQLLAGNENGCADSVLVRFFVDNTRKIFVPNVFSPNNDGVNDLFFIQGEGYGLIRNFRIFDRWGNLLFEHGGGGINDPGTGWDGRFRNREMQTAVFLWTAEIGFLDGAVERFSGDVLLIR